MIMKNLALKSLGPAAIIVLGLLVYADSFQASFHFDDSIYIVNNFFIRSIGHLLHYWTFYPTRLGTFLSLALNYRVNGLNVFGYHLFNWLVHVACSILVWRLVLLTLSTPGMRKDPIIRHRDLIALLAGLVFVSHPVQTEAVTYIWQRTASLAALYYLASLCFYIRSRLCQVQNPALSRFCWIFSILLAVAAMFTKENTVTLPLMVLLYELIFFEMKTLDVRVAFFLLTIFIVPFTLFLTKSSQLQAIEKFTASDSGTSPLSYLFTQFRVMTTYIRLLFLPLGQNIDYDYSISHSFFEGPVLISFLFLAGVFYAALRLFSKYRLISFSIFWFFLTLFLESSLLPLKNIIFEHRLYLPLAGYSIFLSAGMYYLLGKNNMKAMILIMTAMIAANSWLTYQRNKVWTDEVTLWSDAVRKSPHKARAWNNLGFAYYTQGDFARAVADYDKALAIDGGLADAYVGRGLSLAAEGHYAQAIADYDKAIDIQPDFEQAYNNRGTFYVHQGRLDQAMADLNQAIAIDPFDAKAYYNLALSDDKQGLRRQAMADYSRAIAIDPSYTDAYYNRGLSYAQQDDYAQALADFGKAIALKPDYTDAYNNRGIVYAMQDDWDKAIADFTEAMKLNPKDAQAYNNLLNAQALKESWPQTPH